MLIYCINWSNIGLLIIVLLSYLLIQHVVDHCNWELENVCYFSFVIWKSRLFGGGSSISTQPSWTSLTAAWINTESLHVSFSIWIWTAKLCVDPFQFSIWSPSLIGVLLHLRFFNLGPSISVQWINHSTLGFMVSGCNRNLSVSLTLKTLRFSHRHVLSSWQIRNSPVSPWSCHRVVPRSLRLSVDEICTSPVCGLASLLVSSRVLWRLLLDIWVFQDSVLVLQSFVRV